MVTVNSRVPFGNCKNKRIRDCPDKFLEWCVQKLKDTDLHEYAIVAQEVLTDRAGDGKYQNLEAQADALLRRAGYTPDGQSFR